MKVQDSIEIRSVNFWVLLSEYLNESFGKEYCLNPEASLSFQVGSLTIPAQIIIATIKSENSILSLPGFNTRLVIYQDEKRVFDSRVKVRGLQVMILPEALCRVSASFYVSHAAEIELALEQVDDVKLLVKALALVADCLPDVVVRLAGELLQIGRQEDAECIVSNTGIQALPAPRESIQRSPLVLGSVRLRSPHVERLQAMWLKWREDVIAIFPPAPGLPHDTDNYVEQLQACYAADAFNSMTIEGYLVNDELIRKTSETNWNFENNSTGKNSKNVMAARGYHLAFQEVTQSIKAIFSGEQPGKVVQRTHHDWHSKLFAAAVELGAVELHELAGYRTGPVYIRNSKHIPVSSSAIMDAIETLFELLSDESAPAVRAVLGHHLFVYIHPYFDGNGRIGRLLMNSMLASGGYPWTIIRVENRAQYLAALEEASARGNIKPFAQFLLNEMNNHGL